MTLPDEVLESFAVSVHRFYEFRRADEFSIVGGIVSMGFAFFAIILVEPHLEVLLIEPELRAALSGAIFVASGLGLAFVLAAVFVGIGARKRRPHGEY